MSVCLPEFTAYDFYHGASSMELHPIRMVALTSCYCLRQTAHMFRPYKKLIAVFLAVWLPLFSANALAVSTAMHEKEQCPPAAMQQDNGHVMHTPSAGGHDDTPCVGDQAQQGTPCGDCGICHFACGGYLAAPVPQAAVVHVLQQSFAIVDSQFHSVSLTPPVPPPLARS